MVTMVPGRRCAGDRLQQAALDFEIFGDGFDDPIGLGAPGEIVVEIADGDAGGGGGREEGGGARLEGGFEAGANDAIADARVGEREAAGLFLGSELGRDDVEQPAGDAGVGQMSGDAGAHGAGAEDGDTFDLRAGFHDVGRQLLRIQAPGRLARDGRSECYRTDKGGQPPGATHP